MKPSKQGEFLAQVQTKPDPKEAKEKFSWNKPVNKQAPTEALNTQLRMNRFSKSPAGNSSLVKEQTKHRISKSAKK